VRQNIDHRFAAHHFFYHGDLDVALKHFVAPAIAELGARRLVDSWFFVRYTLGGPHLRLRYRLAADGSAPAVAALLESAAASFLERWRCESRLDPEAIRQESRDVLAAAPEDSELYYPNHSLLPFPFAPEVERYGGPDLLVHSLDFFAVSSAEALAAVCGPTWDSAGRRGAQALRMLLRQAWGFAASEDELLSHLGYRLPVGEAIASQVWAKADSDFMARREVFRDILKRELAFQAEAAGAADAAAWPSAAFLCRAASRLSVAVHGAAPAARWQIGHSQLHLTANRLGFFPPQEMHLQRILWRAAHDLAAAEPALWQRLMAATRERAQALDGLPLRGLLEPVTGRPRAHATFN
jgi:hypothetical protein